MPSMTSVPPPLSAANLDASISLRKSAFGQTNSIISYSVGVQEPSRRPRRRRLRAVTAKETSLLASSYHPRLRRPCRLVLLDFVSYHPPEFQQQLQLYNLSEDLILMYLEWLGLRLRCLRRLLWLLVRRWSVILSLFLLLYPLRSVLRASLARTVQ